VPLLRGVYKQPGCIGLHVTSGSDDDNEDEMNIGRPAENEAQPYDFRHIDQVGGEDSS
jgi:hypothetical protein